MYKTFTAFCLGAVELVEVTDQLPGLKYTRGKSMWKVYSRHNETFEKFEDVPEKLQTQDPSQHVPSCIRGSRKITPGEMVRTNNV